MRDDIRIDDLAEVALAILSLTQHSDGFGTRVWKGLDWELLDILYARGWIDNPKSKSKSLALSAEGIEMSEQFMMKHFGK